MIKLTNRKGAEKAVNFGVIGIGQGGGRIADAIASIKMKKANGDEYQAYQVVAINTNPDDLKGLNNVQHKLTLKGSENGAGRVPEKGQEAFEENQEKIITELGRIFDNVDRIMVIAGLGGGTGTGVFLPLLLAVDDAFKKPINLLLTMPRSGESPIEKENAYEKFGLIAENLKYLNVTLIDNEQLLLDYLEKHPNNSEDWLMNANKKIADVIHEVNLITKSFEPLREKHYDPAEFINTLNVPGCITYGKAEIPIPATSSEILLAIKDSLEKGRLAGGFDFSKAQNVAVVMVAPSHLSKKVFELKTQHEIEAGINEFTPRAKYRIVAPYIDPLMKAEHKDDKLIVYSVVSGMTLPEKGRLVKLIEEVNALEEPEEDTLVSSLSFGKKKTTSPTQSIAGGLSSKLKLGKDEETPAEGNDLKSKLSLLGKK